MFRSAQIRLRRTSFTPKPLYAISPYRCRVRTFTSKNKKNGGRKMQKEIKSMEEVREVTAKIKDTTANPAPLGLMGFGMTTVLLNLHNAGLFPL
jgi:hypothetical protein